MKKYITCKGHTPQNCWVNLCFFRFFGFVHDGKLPNFQDSNGWEPYAKTKDEQTDFHGESEATRI